MDTLEKVSAWIAEQKEKGRETHDLDGTIFILSNNRVARISEVNGMFDLEILMPPYAVDFTKG